jgi:hypothetical protein
LFLNKVQSGSYGDAIAVCELDGEWLQGSPGRVLCMKVFKKPIALLRGLIPGIVQELSAYRTMARANSRTENEGAVFVMNLEASFQDSSRLLFVMVRLLQQEQRLFKLDDIEQELMDCDLLEILNGHRFPRQQNARRWICQIVGLLILVRIVLTTSRRSVYHISTRQG